jgi:radical SAM protein with 4Fe4S-binding SPASM domain
MSHVKKEMISFFLTTKCNLDCIYCYANKSRLTHLDHQTLDPEFAKIGIDYFFQHFSSRHLRFFGAGEPTCKLELMKQILEYAKSRTGDPVTTELQTNGAFSEKAKEWLAEYLNIIWVSFDGPPDIQNYYRPFFRSGADTSPILEKNVRYLSKHSKGFTGVRVTINNKNLKRQKEMVDYFESLGVRYIWTDPLFPSVGYRPVSNGTNTNGGKPEIDLLLYVQNFEEAHFYAEKKNMFYGSFLGCNFDEPTTLNCRACIPVPHLTSDGYVSACDMALFGENAHHMDLFIYGKWNRKNHTIDFDEDKIRFLQSRSVQNMPGCKGCPVSQNCAGYCLGEVMNETGDLFGQKTYTCEAIRLLARLINVNEGCYPYLHP